MRSLARRLLDLPPPRHPSEATTEWLALSDGVRLATTRIRPAGVERGPVVLVRTPHPAHARSHMALLFATEIARSGTCVVVQECRGRCASEGEFEPFVNEARDGAETIRWITEQPWCDGRLALVGFRYSGYAAWAALGAAPERVQALVVGFAARDPYAALHRGGALALADALQLAVGLSEREPVARRRLDLARGAAFRPVREADRVTLRRVAAYRTWTEHPRRDAFWRALAAAPPERPPPTLLVAGWYDPALDAQLEDHAALREAAARSGSPPPELVLGPWGDGRGARPRAARGPLASSLRETLAFLARHLDGGAAAGEPVRVQVCGEPTPRGFSDWPPESAGERVLYLRSRGKANTLAGDGRLDDAPGDAGEPADRFTYEPDSPVPTLGGRMLGAGGPADQRPVEARGDVLCYTGEPLAADLWIAGPVRVVLFAASGAPDADFTAKLVDVGPGGEADWVCDGIVRCRWRDGGETPVWLEPDTTVRLEIELGAAARRFRAGHRVRLELSSSNLPRFERNPGSRAEPSGAGADAGVPSLQTVFHDAERPSQLLLPVLDG